VRPKKRSKKDVDDKNGLPTAKKANTDKKPKANRSVYVTGLPPDATTNELKDIFSKYGLLMEDMETGTFKNCITIINCSLEE
jgi:HIV Tat-specific factor 1